MTDNSQTVEEQRAPLVEETEIERAIEAILMIADEPQSLVSLASAMSVPVKSVKTAIEKLVADRTHILSFRDFPRH